MNRNCIFLVLAAPTLLAGFVVGLIWIYLVDWTLVLHIAPLFSDETGSQVFLWGHLLVGATGLLAWVVGSFYLLLWWSDGEAQPEPPRRAEEIP